MVSNLGIDVRNVLEQDLAFQTGDSRQQIIPWNWVSKSQLSATHIVEKCMCYHMGRIALLRLISNISYKILIYETMGAAIVITRLSIHNVDSFSPLCAIST